MSSRSNSLGSGVFADIPFLAFLALHKKWKRCGQVGPSPFYSQSEVVYTFQVLDLELQGFYSKNSIFFVLTFSCYHSNHFPEFLAHVLSWVNTYHHAKFQRNYL